MLTSTVEAEVIRVRGLIQAANHQAALDAAAALRQRVPQNRDVLYMQAVSQRALGRPHAALDTLAELEALHPAYSRLFQERGHCHAAMGRPLAALQAYLQAVNINPALPASWNALAILYARPRRRTPPATWPNCAPWRRPWSPPPACSPMAKRTKPNASYAPS